MATASAAIDRSISSTETDPITAAAHDLTRQAAGLPDRAVREWSAQAGVTPIEWLRLYRVRVETEADGLGSEVVHARE